MSVMDCARRVRCEQGARAFWRGNLANCLRYMPQSGCNLAFKDRAKRIFPVYDPDEHFLRFLLVQIAAGAVGASAGLALCYPLDYVRTRLSADVGRQRMFGGSITTCLRETWAASGVRGVYAGFNVALLDMVFYRSLQYGLFDALHHLDPYRDELSWRGLASGLITAASVTVVVSVPLYPLDTVRNRMMMVAERAETSQLALSRTVSSIWFKEGFRGFFPGLGVGLVRVLCSSLVPLGYEKLKLFT